MSVTIADIAREAGVSPSTVSRVLNGKGRLAESTRQRVLKTAQTLGYQTDTTGGIVGILYTRRLRVLIADPFYGAIMESAEETFRRWDHRVFFSTLSDPEYDAKHLFKNFHYAGLLLVGGDIPSELVRRLQEIPVPLVLVDNEMPELGVDALVIANDQGARAATNHLIELGHKNICYIGGPISHPSLYQRQQGFLAAMATANLPVKEGWVFTDPTLEFGAQLGFAGFKSIVANTGVSPNSATSAGTTTAPAAPTAVVCANDHVALGVLQACAELGLRVPEDISVVGFDDIPTHFGPPLTTVRVHTHQMGCMAAQRLYELITGTNNHPIKIEVSTQLVVRASTAALQR